MKAVLEVLREVLTRLVLYPENIMAMYVDTI